MEGGEVGAQVAAPVFFHKGLPGQFHEAPKKRSFPWQNNPTGFHQAQVVGSNQPNSAGNWNPSSWNWDSIRFTARHVSDLSAGHGDQPDQRRRAEERSNTSPLRNNMVIDGGEGLTLNLGGGAYSGDRAIATSSPLPATRAPAPIPAPAVTATVPSQEPVARPNKRVRSGSPGSGGGGGSSSTGGGGVGASGGYPMCQVDDCRADLSSAKDYHRRHKVCEVHSKTTKALVGKQMQRFCQQCSRFHPLSEFDEGKRSCRRRLAGHNRRRRKTQPTDVASQLLLPGNQDGVSNANLNLVNILTALARLQGNSAEKSTSIPPTADRDGLIQIISKLSSLSGTNQPAKSPPSGGGFDLNISEETHQDSVEQHTTNGVVNQAAPSTLNLLAVLSAASLAASAPNKPIFSNSQGSSDSSGNDKGKTQCVESPNDATKGFNGPIKGQSLNGPCLGLQLFGSSGDESPPKMGSTTTKYLSSESSNPMEEQSPSASPPITRKFFPIHSASEMATDSEAIRISDYKEDGMPVEMSTSRCQPFDLFKDTERRVNGKAVRNGASPVTYSSSAGSDHSPSTSNSDSQDRTGRIVFKLFGKDPSSFPQNIRNQINNWLSSSPTDMESYIRPGCVVLSVYLSMPAFAWDELEENLIQRVTSLVESSDSDFWKNGRFLVRTNRQLVSHKDGMIRLSKSWRTWSSPEVACVSPVAVVGGQKTSLVLRGRNLTVPGTKIYCTHMGKYLSKEVLCSTYPGTIYDDSSIEIFDFPGDEPPINLGRCFIEVENGFKGNSFPIIVASSAICQELRTLEVEFEERVTGDTNGEENGLQRSREDVLHFLNELGWLFQKEANSSSLSSDLIEFSVTRFKYLLVFSVERDWCVVTKTLLEMLTKMSLGNETLAQESLQTVGEMHLLNRAVRRKCRKMVDMLLHFAVPLNNDGNNNNNSSKERKIYPFIPSLAGPNGWTPLHLAASSDAADEIIDALTDDPQQIGLSCWDTSLDESKQTPQMYAMARNKHSYNELVVRKRIDRKNGQVSISIDEGEDGISMDKSVAAESRPPHPHAFQIKTPPPTSCVQCAMMEAVPCIRPTRRGGLLARPYVLSMLGIAAVCVCVCLFMRGRLRINYGRSFKWENLDYGPF